MSPEPAGSDGHDMSAGTSSPADCLIFHEATSTGSRTAAPALVHVGRVVPQPCGAAVPKIQGQIANIASRIPTSRIRDMNWQWLANSKYVSYHVKSNNQ